jgi:hypothetical protein
MLNLSNLVWENNGDWKHSVVASISFGVKDSKGRDVGVKIYVMPNEPAYKKSEVVSPEDEVYYRRGVRHVMVGKAPNFSIHQTRGGKVFGASSTDGVMEGYGSIEEAKAATLAKIEAIYKRTKKNHSS